MVLNVSRTKLQRLARMHGFILNREDGVVLELGRVVDMLLEGVVAPEPEYLRLLREGT